MIHPGHIAVVALALFAGAARAEAPLSAPRPLPRPAPALAVAAPGAEALASAAGEAAAAAPAAVSAGVSAATVPARRPAPRPAMPAADPGPLATPAVLASAFAPDASLRPLRRPALALAAPAPAAAVAAAPEVVTPRDPISAFIQGLTGTRPAMAAAAPVAGTTALAVARSIRPERRPDNFARLIPAVASPRATSRAGSVCGVAEIKGAAISAIDGPGACGVEAPVRVTSVAGIPVAGSPTIDCTTAKALNAWVRDGVIPAVGRTGGGLARLDVIAHYSCRGRNNVKGAKLSEHSFGRAVDVAGVTLRDGTRLTVLDHWGSSKYGKIIKAMHSSACGPFGTVLGPNSDRYHKDHLHIDTARYRSGAYCR